MAAKHPYTAEELAALRVLLRLDLSSAEVARRFMKDFPKRTLPSVRDKIIRLRSNGDAPARTEPEPHLTTSYGSDGGTVSGLVSEPIKTLEDLIRVCAIDTSQFEVTQWTAKAYQQGSKDAEGRMQAQTLYSVAAKLKPLSVLSMRKQLEGILGDIRAEAQRLKAPLWSPPEPTARAVSLYVPDLHLGKLAWAPESGNHYDSDIAAHLYLSICRALLEDAAHYRPELVVLPIGSDMLNVDSGKNMTTAGTPQDVDGRHIKTFQRCVRLIRQVIEEVILPTGARVRLVRVRGNHDEESSFYLGEVLKAVYENWPQVELPAEHEWLQARQYWRWGKVLVMYAHGDTEKRGELPQIMANERRKDWAEILFPEAHTGHLHRVKQHHFVAMEDQKGFIHEELPSLSAPEAWHYRKGYIGSLRLGKAFVYDKETGRLGSLERHAQQFLGPLGAMPAMT